MALFRCSSGGGGGALEVTSVTLTPSSGWKLIAETSRPPRVVCGALRYSKTLGLLEYVYDAASGTVYRSIASSDTSIEAHKTDIATINQEFKVEGNAVYVKASGEGYQKSTNYLVFY